MHCNTIKEKTVFWKYICKTITFSAIMDKFIETIDTSNLLNGPIRINTFVRKHKPKNRNRMYTYEINIQINTYK